MEEFKIQPTPPQVPQTEMKVDEAQAFIEELVEQELEQTKRGQGFSRFFRSAMC